MKIKIVLTTDKADYEIAGSIYELGHWKPIKMELYSQTDLLAHYTITFETHVTDFEYKFLRNGVWENLPNREVHIHNRFDYKIYNKYNNSDVIINIWDFNEFYVNQKIFTATNRNMIFD